MSASQRLCPCISGPLRLYTAMSANPSCLLIRLSISHTGSECMMVRVNVYMRIARSGQLDLPHHDEAVHVYVFGILFRFVCMAAWLFVCMSACLHVWHIDAYTKKGLRSSTRGWSGTRDRRARPGAAASHYPGPGGTIS